MVMNCSDVAGDPSLGSSVEAFVSCQLSAGVGSTYNGSPDRWLSSPSTVAASTAPTVTAMAMTPMIAAIRPGFLARCPTGVTIAVDGSNSLVTHVTVPLAPVLV